MAGSLLILALLSLAAWEFWRYAKYLYTHPEDPGAGGRPVGCLCGKWRLIKGVPAVYDSYGRHEPLLCQPLREVIR